MIELLDELKPGRDLRTNVEFYAGVVMDACGVPPEMFTPTFASSRVIGWSRQRPRTGRRQQDHPPERPLHRPAATAAGARARASAQPGSDLVGQQPAVAGEHEPVAVDGRPARRGPARPAPAPRRARRARCATTAGRPSTRCASASSSSSAALGRPAGRHQRRGSARACARSTTDARRVGVGGAAEAEVVALVASRGGCGGTRGRVGPSWRSRSSASPAAPRQLVGERGTCRPGRRRRDGGRGRRPAACRPRR